MAVRVSDNDDVYSDFSYAAAEDNDGCRHQHHVSIQLEDSPMSLSRVFGLLGTLHAVPAHVDVRLLKNLGIVNVDLSFSGASRLTIDRFCRKVWQLTETVRCTATSAVDIGRRRGSTGLRRDPVSGRKD